MQAAWDTVPNVPVTFWLFRLMAEAASSSSASSPSPSIMRQCGASIMKWFLRAAVIIMPLPRGWPPKWAGVLAEYSRQPWAIRRAPDLPRRIRPDSGAGLDACIAACPALSALSFHQVRLMLAAVTEVGQGSRDEKRTRASNPPTRAMPRCRPE